MATWVRICSVKEAPEAGTVMELESQGTQICLANVAGQLSALDNLCPHRAGPLGQGWLEGELVICPWHSWTFHAKTGISEYPLDERVSVFPVRIEGDDVMIDLSDRNSPFTK